MEAYVDYRFYTEKFKGTAIPESAFDKCAIDASYSIQEMTFDRIQDSVTDDVKMATCAVIEFVFANEGKDGVASESVGNVSVTYADRSTYSARLYNVVAKYLAHTGLLYRGLDC